MPKPLEAGLAPNIVCVGGYVVRLTALNATTGAVVAGVTIKEIALQVDADTPIEEAPPLELSPPVASFSGSGGTESPGLTRG